MAILFSKNIGVNSIYIVRSVPEEDIGPSTRMADNIFPFCLKKNFRFDEVEVNSKSDFEKTISEIHDRISNGFKPIIIFDMHGSKHGMHLADANRSIISWHELSQLARPLNITSNNSLICIFSVCHGINYSKEFSVLEHAPYNIVIGPKDEASSVKLSEAIPEFLSDLFNTEHDLGKSFERQFVGLMELVNSHKIFTLGFINYMRTQCSLEARMNRASYICDEYMKSKGRDPRIIQERIKAKAEIVENLIPNEENYNNYAKQFLGGDTPDFSFNEIQEFAYKKSV